MKWKSISKGATHFFQALFCQEQVRRTSLPHLLVGILLLLLIPSSATRAAPAQQVDSVSGLWLDISLGPPLIPWFNEIARPNDIARIENVSQLDLLNSITAGRKLVVFKSVRDAEQFMPELAGVVDIIGYNLEQGPVNLEAEQQDPVGSAKRMRQLADRYGLQLAFGPDRTFALSDGVAIAPFVDIFVLQVQRVQTQPATVHSFVDPLITQLRAANPDLEISVQIRTEGDINQLSDLVADLKGALNGVSVLTSPETIDIAMALVAELQSRDGSGSSSEPYERPERDGPVILEAPSPDESTDSAANGRFNQNAFPIITFVAGAIVAALIIGSAQARGSE